MKALVICAILLALCSPGICSESFKDVPNDHWAADSVDTLAQKGIVQGYPDKNFRGDKPVTRYELAVALERLIFFIQESRKPLVSGEAAASREPVSGEIAMAFLKTGGFLPADSPMLKDGSKPVTADELGQALARVSARLIELSVPAQAGAERSD